MVIGRLDRRIKIQSISSTPDAHGGVEKSKTDVATVWARVIDVRGREVFESAQVNSEITTRFILRYRKDVTPRHIIEYRNEEFDVIAVNEIGRRRGLEILAKARV